MKKAPAAPNRAQLDHLRRRIDQTVKAAIRRVEARMEPALPQSDTYTDPNDYESAQRISGSGWGVL